MPILTTISMDKETLHLLIINLFSIVFSSKCLERKGNLVLRGGNISWHPSLNETLMPLKHVFTYKKVDHIPSGYSFNVPNTTLMYENIIINSSHKHAH